MNDGSYRASSMPLPVQWRARAQRLRDLRERIGETDVVSEAHRVQRRGDLQTLAEMAAMLEQCALELERERNA